MNKQKEYVDKVIDQIVSETIMDYEKGEIQFPFRLLPLRLSDVPFLTSSSHFIYLLPFFTKHCRNIYGLNDDEVEYAWVVYKDIINDKLNNGY